MSCRPINFVSLNINGILNPIKRSNMLSQLKKTKVQIAYMQESHLTDSEHTKLNRMGHSKVYFSSHSSGRRRGVAILLSNKVNFHFISEDKDKEGRYIMVKGKIDGVLVSLLNVYMPPGSNWAFYKQILELSPICGGDLT